MKVVQTVLTKELNDVESQMERCNAKMEEVHQKMSDFPQFSEEQVLNQIPNFKEFTKQVDREEIRIRIQQCIEKVTVFNEKIEVDFAIPFFLTKNEKVPYTFHSSISRSALNRRTNQICFSSNFQYLTEKLHSA